MSAKREARGTVTHVNLICMAIRCCDYDIETYTELYGGHPEQLELVLKGFRETRETLKQLYRIETGTEY